MNPIVELRYDCVEESHIRVHIDAKYLHTIGLKGFE